MGIVFNNAIRNGGNMPKIQATTDINAIVGQLNSLALDTTNSNLYFWDYTGSGWNLIYGGGALNLQQVLSNGYQAASPIEITGQNITVNEASLLARDVNLTRAIVANGDGIIFGNYDLTDQYYILSLLFGNPVQSITNSVGGTINLAPGSNTGTIAVSLPKTDGQLYCIDIFEITLVNGTVTFSPGGQNNLILGVGIKSAIGALGVAYKWAGTGGSGSITITSLKTNGTTEASDLSVLYVTIAL